MISAEMSRNCRMSPTERLINLFKAHRAGDDAEFRRIAESFISDELIANHHAQARDMQKAIQGINSSKKGHLDTQFALTPLPTGRRDLGGFVTLISPTKHNVSPVLSKDANEQLDRVILEQSSSEKLSACGLSPKSRIIFWGPPGCGKSMSAQWLASELDLPLGIVNLSSIITSYLGETASNIQRVFDAADRTPMVLFFDEADAISKERDDRNDVGELKRIVNALLQAIDRFQTNRSLIIFASNHQYLFDDALWRRFDDVISFPLPDSVQIRAFITQMLNGVTVCGSLDGTTKAATGFSFAEVEKVVLDVVKLMVIHERKEVQAGDLTRSFNRYRKLIRHAKSRPK